MIAPKLRFSRGLKAKAPGAVTACVPGPLRRRSSKFLQARRPRLAQEATTGKVTIFFSSRVFPSVWLLFYQRSDTALPLGISPDSWLAMFHSQRCSYIRTDDPSTKAMARRAFTVIWNVEVFVHSRSVVISPPPPPPGAPVTSFLSQQISTVIRSPRFQQDETSWALSSIAVVTKATKHTARTSLSHLGTATTLFPAIWTKTARSIEELFSQWKRPRRASSDQQTGEEDTSETCNNNHAGGRALTNA